MTLMAQIDRTLTLATYYTCFWACVLLTIWPFCPSSCTVP